MDFRVTNTPGGYLSILLGWVQIEDEKINYENQFQLPSAFSQSSLYIYLLRDFINHNFVAKIFKNRNKNLTSWKDGQKEI